MTNYLNFFKAYPIYIVGALLTIFPVLLMWRKRAYRQKPFFFLFVFLCYKLVNDLVMIHFASFQINNLFLNNLNMLVRYVLFSCMYYHLYSSAAYRRLLLRVSILFSLLAVAEIYVSLGSLSTSRDNTEVQFTSTLECVLMICWILLYYYEVMRTLRITNLLASPPFLISAGLLMFYAVYAFVAPVMKYVNRWEPALDIGFMHFMPVVFEVGCILIILFSFVNYPRDPNGSGR